METVLKMGRWGNSSAIRIPKTILKKVGISSEDKEVRVEVTSDKITIKPVKEEKLLDKLFKDYDSNQPYPFEIVDKGGAIGEELI